MVGRRGITAILTAGAIAGGALVTTVVTGGGGGGTVGCDTTLNSGANVASAVNSAAAGSTLCLNAGNYTWTAGTYTKTATVTVRPASGVAASAVNLAQVVLWENSKNLTFQDMTIGSSAGSIIGTSSGLATNLTFQNIHWADCLLINQYVANVMNITLDGGVFDGPGGTGTGSPCGDDGRIRLYGGSTGHASGNCSVATCGVTIKNMDIKDSGHCTDGIAATGGWENALIQNNTFHGIKQNGAVSKEGVANNCGSFGTHVDPIQFYGANKVTVDHNYFYNDGDNIMSPDGNGDDATITNNVFGTEASSTYGYAVVDCGGDNWTFKGNTVAAGKQVKVCAADSQSPIDATSGSTFTDNVLVDGLVPAAGNNQADFAGYSANHNMCSGGVCNNGAGGISSSPTYAGGSAPSTFAGYALTAPLAALTGATDGGPLGVRP